MIVDFDPMKPRSVIATGTHGMGNYFDIDFPVSESGPGDIPKLRQSKSAVGSWIWSVETSAVLSGSGFPTMTLVNNGVASGYYSACESQRDY